MKIKTILVPTDFSMNAQLAFNHAFELAQQTGARIILLHIQTDSPLRAAARAGLYGAELVNEKNRAQREVFQLSALRFAEMLAGYDTSEVNVKSIVRRGDADERICSYAEANKVDVIVIGSRGTSLGNSIRKVLLGSVAQSVLQKSKTPVIVINPRAKMAKAAAR